MKIDGIRNKPISSKSKNKTVSSQGLSFMNLLEGQIEPVDKAEPMTTIAQVQETSSAPAATRIAGLTLSERTIDILAAFGEALENLDISEADLRPLVDALQDETTALLDIKEQLDADDPLYELLDRVAAVAYLESEKFHRGDYGS